MPDKQKIQRPATAQVVELSTRRQPSPADPCAMVIFGASGDLTKRLVVPALYNLSRSKVLPEQFALDRRRPRRRGLRTAGVTTFMTC